MKKIIFLVITAAIVILVVSKLFDNRKHNISQMESLSVDEVSVNAANVVKKPLQFSFDFTGTVYPFTEVDIPAETQGKITALKFELGKKVKRGDTIAVIDDKVKQLNYNSLKLEADKKHKDFIRIENLYKDGTVSEQSYNEAYTEYETAKNNLDESEKQLLYTKVTSSIDGIISKKNIEEGEYVNAGNSIASVVDISRLKVKLNVSESNVYFLKTGDSVRISTDIYPGVEYKGKISFISPYGEDTHNYPVEIEMANSEKHPLKAGAFVNVGIDIDLHKEGLVIPREALQGSIKDAQIYIVENGKAKLKKILIGREIKEQLEVLSGLNLGDIVIISGQVNLTDNKPVKIINK